MTAAFEQAWAFLKADFSDLSGGEGLGNSRAKMFSQFAQYARDDGRDKDAEEMEQEAIDALVGELTEEDLAQLSHGQNYDPHFQGTPLQVYRGRRTNNPYGAPVPTQRLGSKEGNTYRDTNLSYAGDGEGRFTDFRVLDDAYLNPRGPLGTGEQQ